MNVFRPIAPGDVADLAARIRPMDLREIRAMHGPDETVAQVLERCVAASTQTAAVVVGDQLQCLLGVAPDLSVKLGGVGVPWLLGAVGIERHWAHFARGARRVVGMMHEHYQHLRNFVHAENKPAIKLLAWCGFSLRDPQPFGADAELFHLFEKEA